MDSPGSSKATSSSSKLSKRKKKAAKAAAEKALLASKRAKFFATVRRQCFAFPDSIMHYIAMYPATPKGYKSVVKTCKFFFIKNPILVTSATSFYEDELRNADGGRRTGPVDLTKLTSKLWVINEFAVRNSVNQNIVSNIIPKFYQFDAKKLSISHQTFLQEEYCYLAFAVEDIFLYDVTIKDENGDVLPLEKVVAIASKVIWFAFFTETIPSNVTSNTAKELFENPDFSRLERFSVNHIPDTFDIDVFYAYMMKNHLTDVDLKFDASISDAFKNRLDKIVYEIIATEGILDFARPLLRIHGNHDEQYDKLKSVYERQFEH